MAAPLTAFPSFKDLKKNNAFEGGFSDGGVECFSETLTTQGVDITPRPGTAFGGFGLPNADPASEPLNACVTIFNFDTVNPCDVQMYIVYEDGTTALVGVGTIPQNSVTALPHVFLITTHPNKLHFKLAPNGVNPLPTARVLLKGTFLLYDKPADLED